MSMHVLVTVIGRLFPFKIFAGYMKYMSVKELNSPCTPEQTFYITQQIHY